MCCSALFNNYIFIAGHGMHQVLSYNPSTDEFRLYSKVTSESYKIICCTKDCVFVFSGSRIYEGKNPENNWTGKWYHEYLCQVGLHAYIKVEKV
jgi:hypothetical protein